ncbi:gamma-glutamyltransferase family protein [Tautonia rosea]|uniref:gamma-glutamyltransferase family protein n=1 Tax=Tautonia rosea TaxID=2728037 RepID=UPI001473CBD8|nr:gamma-glutamyltransferase [Tautonia rosea]
MIARVLMFAIVLMPFSARSQDDRARPTRPPADSAIGWHASGQSGAVVAGGAESVEAGMAILQQGGNAIDAAVGTLLALSVTDAHLFCFGGEVPILIYDAERGVVESIAGQGAAPRLATLEHFEAKGGIPRSGIESAAVPAFLDACLTALDRSGSMSFTQVVAPTLQILDRGEHPWHANLARTLRRLIEAEAAASDRRQGLRLVANVFYRGPIAVEIDAWSRAHGGLIRYADLATHVTRVEEPVSLNYRGHRILKCGPWTQGPALLQALQILEAFDLSSHSSGDPDAIHLQTEALKLAFADRDEYYADPLYAPVPLNLLLNSDYAASRRSLIDPDRASLDRIPGDPAAGQARLDPERSTVRIGTDGPSLDTTTCIVADSLGNVVAATPSGWSGVLAGETGVWLGSRLQSFNTWPNHPNVIEPGKRPRITLTPTIVLKDETPVIAVSVAGGDAQDQSTLQMLTNLIDFGLSPSEAVTAPRFNSEHLVGSFGQPAPELGLLRIDPRVGDEVLAELEARGHRIQPSRSPVGSNPTVLRIHPDTGLIEAAGCPDSRRHAAAY